MPPAATRWSSSASTSGFGALAIQITLPSSTGAQEGGGVTDREHLIIAEPHRPLEQPAIDLRHHAPLLTAPERGIEARALSCEHTPRLAQRLWRWNREPGGLAWLHLEDASSV